MCINITEQFFIGSYAICMLGRERFTLPSCIAELQDEIHYIRYIY